MAPLIMQGEAHKRINISSVIDWSTVQKNRGRFALRAIIAKLFRFLFFFLLSFISFLFNQLNSQSQVPSLSPLFFIPLFAVFFFFFFFAVVVSFLSSLFIHESIIKTSSSLLNKFQSYINPSNQLRQLLQGLIIIDFQINAINVTTISI